MDGIASSVPLIARPSFDRACSFVPSEYVQAWEWFLREEQRGGLWDKLPYRTNADSPQYPFRLTIDSEPFPVSRDSGIFWPGRGRVKHPREKPFALSVHNSKRGAYPDVPPLYLEDGTWVLKYSSQSASVENWRDQDYNQKMINCMECGVPVGVFFATSAGYKVLGLAFVERYEPENSWFVLHGPVHKGGPDARFFPDMSYMKEAPISAEFSGTPASDDEKVRYALRRERIGQQRFRNQLFEAYTGRCAVSGCNVDEALEAAHIENYSGPKSQVVSNGILLRRDLHSLFDAHLISFELVRGDYQLCGSYLLQHTDYATFAGSVLREPDEHRFRPNARFLEAHRAEFDFSESRRHAEAVAPYWLGPAHRCLIMSIDRIALRRIESCTILPSSPQRLKRERGDHGMAKRYRARRIWKPTASVNGPEPVPAR